MTAPTTETALTATQLGMLDFATAEVATAKLALQGWLQTVESSARRFTFYAEGNWSRDAMRDMSAIVREMEWHAREVAVRTALLDAKEEQLRNIRLTLGLGPKE